MREADQGSIASPSVQGQAGALVTRSKCESARAQGCDSQQVRTPASWSLYQMGTFESGMAKESQARRKIGPWSLQTLSLNGQNQERRADWSPTLSEGRAGSFGLSLIPRTYLQG